MAKTKLVVSATIEETFSDFIISKKTKGLAEKSVQIRKFSAIFVSRLRISRNKQNNVL